MFLTRRSSPAATKIELTTTDSKDLTTMDRSFRDVESKMMTNVESQILPVTLDAPFEGASIQDVEIHEMRDLLARPTKIAEGVLDATLMPVPAQYGTAVYQTYINGTTPAGMLGIYDFPRSIFQNNPVVEDKASQFTYMKADVEIELKLNASPFVQGCVMLNYMPMFNELEDFPKYSNLTRESVTSYPNTILSLDQGTTIVFTVPYVSPYDQFDLSTPGFQFGTVGFWLLSSIKGADSNASCAYTLFARFKNIEISVPHSLPATVYPGANVNRMKRMLKHATTEEREQLFKHFVAQSEGDKTGPVESIADTVSGISNKLEDVPIVGEIAKGVSWVSNTVGKIAHFFGWSKPVDTVIQQSVQRVPGKGYTHTVGKDDSVTLGMLNEVKIDPTKSLMSSEDEMVLAKVLRHRNLVREFSWSDGLGFGEMIGNFLVHPLTAVNFDQTQIKSQNGSFAYATSMFNLWRGGLKFKFDVIKTKFHAGRFAVVYFPRAQELETTLGSLLSTNYSAIIDINEVDATSGTTSTFEFEVPYTMNRGFMPLYRESTGAANAGAAIGLYALTRLQRPDTVSPNVSVLLYREAGEGFELAMPGAQHQLYLEDEAQKPDPRKIDLIAQSGQDVCGSKVPLFPQTRITKDSMLQCVSEPAVSLRALLKRFTEMYPGSIYTLSPAQNGPTDVVIGQYPSTGQNQMLSTRDAILNLFRFSYGGHRIKFFPSERSLVTARLGFTNEARKDPVGVIQTNVTHKIDSSIHNVMEVDRPFYSNFKLVTNGVKPSVADSFGYTYATTTLSSHSFGHSGVRWEFALFEGDNVATIRMDDVSWFYIRRQDLQTAAQTCNSLQFVTVEGAVPTRTVDLIYSPGVGEEGPNIQNFDMWFSLPTPLGKFRIKVNDPNATGSIIFTQSEMVDGVYLEAGSDDAGASFMVGPPATRRV